MKMNYKVQRAGAKGVGKIQGTILLVKSQAHEGVRTRVQFPSGHMV